MSSIAKHYVMVAKAGMGDDLRAALVALADAVRRLPGCKGVELLHDLANAERFVFVEKWESVAAHKSAGALLSKEALAPVMAAIAQRPEDAYLEYLEIA